jgi:predicted DNA-binding transcriptional regulator AlpA
MRQAKPRKPKRPRLSGTAVIYPRGLEARYGWSSPTRWRAERDGRVPKRDVFIGGEAVGWRPETLEAAERGEGRVTSSPKAKTPVGSRLPTGADQRHHDQHEERPNGRTTTAAVAIRTA